MKRRTARGPGCLLIMFFLFSLPLSYAAPAKKIMPEGTPTRAIQNLDGMLDAYILNPKTAEEKEFNADLKRKILHGTFDIRRLCQIALDRHWNDLPGRKQDGFVDLMTRLLEKKAIFSKEKGVEKSSGDVYYVTYEDERFLDEKKSLSLVHTLVHIPSENLKIALDYNVAKIAREWKIYDVIVDEASLADNYRYQFDRIISQHGYDDLVRRMESKLKDLESQKEGGASLKGAGSMKPASEKKKSWWGCRLQA